MQIKKSVLENILGICREAYPMEIGGILLGKPIVDDFVLVPGEFSANSIYIQLHNIPIYVNLIGTFHSHPAPIARPSGADLQFFRKIGKEHMIVAYPYNLNSMQAFDSKGNKKEINVI